MEYELKVTLDSMTEQMQRIETKIDRIRQLVGEKYSEEQHKILDKIFGEAPEEDDEGKELEEEKEREIKVKR